MKQGHKEVLYKLKMKQNEKVNKSGKIISWHTLIFKKYLFVEQTVIKPLVSIWYANTNVVY